MKFLGGYEKGGGCEGVPLLASDLGGGGGQGEADGEAVPPLRSDSRDQGQLPDRHAHLLHQAHAERYYFLFTLHRAAQKSPV